MIRLKELESWLQELQDFDTPKVTLEQYQTPPHIAAHIAHTIQASFGDLEGKLVADLGCGCGMLTAAAAIMGAATVVGFDIDSDALEICKGNLEELEIASAELVQADVRALTSSHPRLIKHFDTVLLNPPFGTKRNQGADLEFVQVALEVCRGPVYSLHKTSTRTHIIKTAARWGLNVQVLAQLHYDLPNTYKFHKKKSVDIEVDFIRFTHEEDLSN
ncbi:rRNA N6-adenosine-methyltransferase METTL5-like [Eriocheir sinensis]|uniref:rRNA N6-adenosine-methyltransferase METTL5-like n=1 Tax=Eriocheir sinensis TaxID=95602 RepID=UPI0021C64FE6|nr:rRNA N6-adenosine-methyltransferase METTL5-like [Eriocheir sinensis]